MKSNIICSMWEYVPGLMFLGYSRVHAQNGARSVMYPRVQVCFCQPDAVSRNRAHPGALLMLIQSGLMCDLQRGSGLVLTAVSTLTQAAKPNWFVFCSVVCCSQLPTLRLGMPNTHTPTHTHSDPLECW